MKKIVLFCAAGMSTSLLVTKMQKAAAELGLDYEIAAHAVAEVSTFGPEADIILLGPQVRFEQKRVEAAVPGKKVEPIDMLAYGMMDGMKVIKHVKDVIGE